MSLDTEPSQPIIISSSSSSPSSYSDDGVALDLVKMRPRTQYSIPSGRARIASPLQQSFPTLSIEGSEPESNQHTDTPTRTIHNKENNTTRGRSMSRSVSVPSSVHLSLSQKRDDTTSLSPKSDMTAPITKEVTRNSTSSVKHLTCYWWKQKGSCRFKDEDCLYAHHDTGHYTDAPRQVVPGEPALAGRKLDRAMRNLNFAPHRSSTSLNSMAGSRNTSRPSTPVLSGDYSTHHPIIGIHSPITSPTAFQLPYSTEPELVRLSSENEIFRKIVDQSTKEKSIFMNAIESLQADNKGMKGELEGLRKAQEQLLAERDMLHIRIQQLEDQQSQSLSMTRSSSNPFGAIGRGRVTTESRYIGGLLQED